MTWTPPWLPRTQLALAQVLDQRTCCERPGCVFLACRDLQGLSPARKVAPTNRSWEEGCVVSDGLRLLRGGAVAVPVVGQSVDPVVFQDSCLRAFEASQVARGFAQTTMDNGAGVLDRFLVACDRPAWEVTREDVDRVVAGLVGQGLSAATRRGYVQTFKGFHAFLSARKAGEIEAAFGVRMVDPVDGFNAARHVDSSSPSATAPPSPQRMEEFFDFLKERVAGARKYAAAGRDYAMFRTLYLAGLRAEETASLDRADVHFGRGPFGKIHVRFGKGAKTSGPRPRWVPMLDGLDLILGWYLEEIAPRLGGGPALFCDEGGGRIHRGTIRNRLAYLLDLEREALGQDGQREHELVRFSPHTLRHACVISPGLNLVRDVGHGGGRARASRVSGTRLCRWLPSPRDRVDQRRVPGRAGGVAARRRRVVGGARR